MGISSTAILRATRVVIESGGSAKRSNIDSEIFLKFITFLRTFFVAAQCLSIKLKTDQLGQLAGNVLEGHEHLGAISPFDIFKALLIVRIRIEIVDLILQRNASIP